MSKKINIAIACILSAFLLLPCVPHLTAHANSAQTHWSGRDSFGAYVTDENCPVVVEGEKLTLNIPEFPSNYFSEEAFEGYNANVTAEYTFHNPADYDVEMTLAFPFGKHPDYLYDRYDFNTGKYLYYDDTSLYALTSDGEEIERNIRYTLNSWKFDPQIDLARLSSEKRTYDFITPETPVASYTYEFNPENFTHGTCATANFYGLGDPSKTLILLSEFSMGEYGSKKEICGSWISRNNVQTIYVIGEPLQKMPEWKMYENGEFKKEVAGKVTLSSKHTLSTFNEFALTYFDKEGEVGEVDWYNAVLDSIAESREEGRLVAKETHSALKVENNLMRWYEYNLSIPAGGRVVNSVAAPLYPAIDASWSPAIYSYTYLLSPASTWTDFGSFEVIINTPYFLVESSLNFKDIYGDDINNGAEVDNRYEYSQQGLPEGELTFTLSTEKSPQKKRQSLGTTIANFMLFIGIPIIFAFVAVGIIVAIVLIIVHAVRKKIAVNNSKNKKGGCAT